jgi:hypothetical protein
MKEVRGGHLEDILMQIILAVARGRHGNGGPQELGVADTGMSAVALYLVAVNLDNLVNSRRIGSFNRQAS